MTKLDKKNLCRRFRFSLTRLIGNRVNAKAAWIQSHLAWCPRCHARLRGFYRLELALSLLKLQTHGRDLLSRANQQVIGVLQRPLRQTQRAETLKKAEPKPCWRQRCLRYTQGMGNAAACVSILLLMRAGVFGSMSKIDSQGRQTMQHYYERHLGEDASEITGAFKA